MLNGLSGTERCQKTPSTLQNPSRSNYGHRHLHREPLERGDERTRAIDPYHRAELHLRRARVRRAAATPQPGRAVRVPRQRRWTRRSLRRGRHHRTLRARAMRRWLSPGRPCEAHPCCRRKRVRRNLAATGRRGAHAGQGVHQLSGMEWPQRRRNYAYSGPAAPGKRSASGSAKG